MAMAAAVASTKTSLQNRLSASTHQRWPQLAGLALRFRGAFAYVSAGSLYLVDPTAWT